MLLKDKADLNVHLLLLKCKLSLLCFVAFLAAGVARPLDSLLALLSLILITTIDCYRVIVVILSLVSTSLFLG